MLKADSGTLVMYFIFILVVLLVVFVYDSNGLPYSDNTESKKVIYRKKRRLSHDEDYDNNNNEDYYVYNQSFIDELEPAYM